MFVKSIKDKVTQKGESLDQYLPDGGSYFLRLNIYIYFFAVFLINAFVFMKYIDHVGIELVLSFFKESHLDLAIFYFSLAYLGVRLDDFKQFEKYVEKLKLMDGVDYFKKNLVYLKSFLGKVSCRDWYEVCK